MLMATPEQGFKSVQDVFEHFKQSIAGMQEQIQQHSGGQSLRALVSDFVNAIDWSERWIQAIIATHIVLLGASIIWRRSMAVQLSIFAVGCSIVFCAQPLNSLGADYWEEFARQPYFDSRGAFFSGVISLPLVLIMTVVIVNIVISTLQEAARLQRRKLAARAHHHKRA